VLHRHVVGDFLPRDGADRVPLVASTAPRSGFADLTRREREVIRLVARGHDNQGICDELLLAEVTVNKHVRRIKAKLGATSRTQLAVAAIRLDLD
jgi:DNA-binding NarL/FixJ family response regulator